MYERMQRASSGRYTTDLIIDTFPRSHGADSHKRTEAGSIAPATTDTEASSSQQALTLSPAVVAGHQGQESKNQRGRMYMNTGMGSPQRHKTIVQDEPRGGGKQVGNRAVYPKGRNRMQLGNKLAKADDTQGTHNQRQYTSPCNPLQTRDDNTPAPTWPEHTEHGVGSRWNNCSDCDVVSESSAAMFGLVQDPFDVVQRRRMTTDTIKYSRWVRSCQVVHNVRQGGIL